MICCVFHWKTMLLEKKNYIVFKVNENHYMLFIVDDLEYVLAGPAGLSWHYLRWQLATNENKCNVQQCGLWACSSEIYSERLCFNGEISQISGLLWFRFSGLYNWCGSMWRLNIDLYGIWNQK